MLVVIMVCVTRIYERPELRDPVLIEGLPGIGFVANIATLHLIQELGAKPLAEIRSSAFEGVAITAENGKVRFPTNTFYYHKRRNGGRDLILLYGNTQALTPSGQYELCGCILDIAKGLGCRYVITLGGLKREQRVNAPKVYCAASDPETLKEALNLGVEVIEGRIFGIAGLLIGLSQLRDMKGLCLLAETPGDYPDSEAAREALKLVCRMLDLKMDFSRLDLAAEATRDTLKSLGMIPSPVKEREEPRFRGLI